MSIEIEKIRKIVASELANSPDATHDMAHVERVHNLALFLAEKIKEPIDLEVLEIATIMHDIAGAKELADPSGKTDHAVLGAQMAGEILAKEDYDKNKIEQVKHCIISHRYRTENPPESLEAKILFDADKLDSVGAIGIARNFTWVGRNNANIYRHVENIQDYLDENMGGKMNGRIKDKTKHSPQIEYEVKICRLIDKLQTEQAKEIGRERLKYHKDFLDRLETEIKGLA